MRRSSGLFAFGVGMVALFAMLAIDVFGIQQVPTIWFAGLAMVLTGVMWVVPTLRPRFGKRSDG